MDASNKLRFLSLFLNSAILLSNFTYFCNLDVFFLLFFFFVESIMECYTDLLPNKYPGSNYFLESEVTSTYECHMACMESPRCQMSSLILDGGLVCRLYDNRDEELEDNDNAVVFMKTCMQGKNIGSLLAHLSRRLTR